MERGEGFMSRLRIFCAVLCVAIGFSQFSLDPVLGAIPACADVHVVWARGSDVDIGNDTSFNRFFARDLARRVGSGVTMNARSLGDDGGYGGHQYRAVGDLAALLSAGDEIPGSYETSVNEGVQELVAYLSDRTLTCPDEIYVLAGHSQGAEVISDGLNLLPRLVRDKVAYTAVFGDPTWDNGPYSFGLPLACVQGPEPWVRGSAPCWAGPGILGLSKDPYVAEDAQQRVGAWCRDGDGICSGAPAYILANGEAHGGYFDENRESAEAARDIAASLAAAMPDKASEFDTSWDQFVFGAHGADLAIVFDTPQAACPLRSMMRKRKQPRSPVTG